MKFKCDKCGTRYTIAEEKVRHKVLRIRCKVCEHVIIVRDPETAAAGAAPVVPAATPLPAGDLLAPTADLEWFAAPGGNQVGPMPLERLRDLIRSGGCTAEDFVWNETMTDWRPSKEVPELAEAFAPRKPAGPPRIPDAAPPARPREGSQPAARAPEPRREVSQPAARAPEPRREVSQPAARAPEPRREGSQPAARAPEPRREASQPAARAPEPRREGSQPAARAPEPRREGSQPAARAPEPRREGSQPAARPPRPPLDSEPTRDIRPPLPSDLEPTRERPSLRDDPLPLPGIRGAGRDRPATRPALDPVGPTLEALAPAARVPPPAEEALPTLPHPSLREPATRLPSIFPAQGAPEEVVPPPRRATGDLPPARLAEAAVRATERTAPPSQQVAAPSQEDELSAILAAELSAQPTLALGAEPALAPERPAAPRRDSVVSAPPRRDSVVSAPPRREPVAPAPEPRVRPVPRSVEEDFGVGEESDAGVLASSSAPGGAGPGPTHVSVIVPVPTSKLSWALIAGGAVVLLGAGLGIGLWMGRGKTEPPPGPPVVASAPQLPSAKPTPTAPPAPQPVSVAQVDAGVPDAAVAQAPRDGGHGGATRPRVIAAAGGNPTAEATGNPGTPQPAVGRFGDMDSRRSGSVVPEVPRVDANENLPSTLESGDIQLVIKRNVKGIQSCYQRQLKKDDSMTSGRATLRFKIRPDGRTTDIELERRFDNTVLKQCLVSMVERWMFPRFTGDPIPVEYPIIFTASM